PARVDCRVAFGGAARAGVSAIPLNPLLSTEVYAYIRADSRATAMVAAAPLARNILPILERVPRLRTVMLLDGSADDVAAFSRLDVHAFSQLIAQQKPVPFTAPTVSDEV